MVCLVTGALSFHSHRYLHPRDLSDAVEELGPRLCLVHPRVTDLGGEEDVAPRDGVAELGFVVVQLRRVEVAVPGLQRGEHDLDRL